MPPLNLGNVTALIKSVDPPTKTYVLWAKILDPGEPDVVEMFRHDGTDWVPLISDSAVGEGKYIYFHAPGNSTNEADGNMRMGINGSGAWVHQKRVNGGWENIISDLP